MAYNMIVDTINLAQTIMRRHRLNKRTHPLLISYRFRRPSISSLREIFTFST
jgi:hypothetical protein